MSARTARQANSARVNKVIDISVSRRNAAMSLRDYLREALGVLEESSRRRLRFIVATISGLALLDLAGLFVVLALTVTATHAQSGFVNPQTLPLPRLVLRAVSLFGINSTFSLAGILAALAVLLFVGKAVFAALGLRYTLHFLAGEEALLSARLSKRLLAAPLAFHLRRRSLDLATDVTLGAECLIMKGVAPACLMFAEIVLVALISIGLVLLAPIVAGVAVGYFSCVLFVLNRVIGHRAASAGADDARSTHEGLMLLQWAVGGFREVATHGAQERFASMIHDVRKTGAHGRADTAYLGWLPRYFLEASLVTGMALVYLVQIPFTGATEALSGLALFAVSGFRLLPSLQRIQAALALAKSGQVYGERCLSIREALRSECVVDPPVVVAPLALTRGVDFDGVSYRYPGAKHDALNDLNLTFARGRTTALVGASGSGKTTALDVLLGLLPVTRGRVLVDDVPVADVASAWRRSVGYVPQSTFLMPASVRDNVSLASPREAVDDAEVWKALKSASLDAVVRSLPGQLDYVLGDAGAGLSGGQRQRLGIARALYMNPTVLILDEATSALDVDTEAEITETIARLDAALTKIVVAHRLATVRTADHIMYFENGRVRAEGSFSYVSAQVPDFARQIALSGIQAGVE